MPKTPLPLQAVIYIRVCVTFRTSPRPHPAVNDSALGHRCRMLMDHALSRLIDVDNSQY